MTKHKLTSKQLARTILSAKIRGFCDFYQEFEDLEIDELSSKKQAEFDRHLDAYVRRILKLLKATDE